MIDCQPTCRSRRCWIFTAAALVYFVMFPGGLEALLAPLKSILTLSSDLSLGLSVVAAVALICWTVQRIWSRRDDIRTSSKVE